MKLIEPRVAENFALYVAKTVLTILTSCFVMVAVVVFFPVIVPVLLWKARSKPLWVNEDQAQPLEIRKK